MRVRDRSNLSVVAARAAARQQAERAARVRPDMPATVTGPVRRTRAMPLTATQRDSEGHRSDWSRSMTVGGRLRPVIVDQRWDRTVSGDAS